MANEFSKEMSKKCQQFPVSVPFHFCFGRTTFSHRTNRSAAGVWTHLRCVCVAACPFHGIELLSNHQSKPNTEDTCDPMENDDSWIHAESIFRLSPSPSPLPSPSSSLSSLKFVVRLFFSFGKCSAQFSAAFSYRFPILAFCVFATDNGTTEQSASACIERF